MDLPRARTSHDPARGAGFAARAWWGWAVQAACLLCLCALLAAPGPSAAQAPNAVDAAALIEQAREDMAAVRIALAVESAGDTALLDARRKALAARGRADEAAQALAVELAAVQARLTELGTPADGVKEPADIAVQRAAIVKTQTSLDAQVKLAKLLSVEAEQAAATLWAQRRSQFNAQLFERTHAATSGDFWRELWAEVPADLRRLDVLLDELRARAAAVTWGAWLAAAAAIAALLLARKPTERFMLHLISTRAPVGRLRRSLHAGGVILVWTLLPGLAAHSLFLALTSGAAVSPPLRALLAGFDGIIWFGGFCTGLGLALLMPGKPSWRLAPIADATALRLRWFPPTLAVAMVLAWFSTRLSTAADASLASTVALKSLGSATMVLVLLVALTLLRRSRREQLAAARAEEAARSETPAATGRTGHDAVPVATSLWFPTLASIATGVLALTLLGLLAGYVALGGFVTNQLVWGLIVAATAYFLAILVDDLFMALLAPTAQPVDADAAQAPGKARGAPQPAPHRTREQTAVLLSGLSRIALILLAIVLVLAPFGEGPLELFQRAGRVNEGLSIGEIRLLPATLLQGLLVLVVGLFVVRRLRDWLGDKFMPTTRMDAGMRMSVTTLVGYVGAVGVVALAMSAVGVGLERVAWVASALSVGIGFGLQAVVQNFVSGLILLAERPVKVGDWVSLAGVEGDIRRINVRATEIQMGDRSTVIVPNSEFITKIVRNVTYTDPIGMVQIKLPMPLATDTRKARAVLLDAFLAHPGVLDAPKPNVQLDGIDGHHLVFNATGFVSSPRASYGVKSELLFEVLERLREAGLDLALPPTMVLSPATAVAGPPVAPAPAAAAAPAPDVPVGPVPR